jgi:hypothetical protein
MSVTCYVTVLRYKCGPALNMLMCSLSPPVKGKFYSEIAKYLSQPIVRDYNRRISEWTNMTNLIALSDGPGNGQTRYVFTWNLPLSTTLSRLPRFQNYHSDISDTLVSYLMRETVRVPRS